MELLAVEPLTPAPAVEVNPGSFLEERRGRRKQPCQKRSPLSIRYPVEAQPAPVGPGKPVSPLMRVEGAEAQPCA